MKDLPNQNTVIESLKKETTTPTSVGVSGTTYDPNSVKTLLCKDMGKKDLPLISKKKENPIKGLNSLIYTADSGPKSVLLSHEDIIDALSQMPFVGDLDSVHPEIIESIASTIGLGSPLHRKTTPMSDEAQERFNDAYDYIYDQIKGGSNNKERAVELIASDVFKGWIDENTLIPPNVVEDIVRKSYTEEDFNGYDLTDDQKEECVRVLTRRILDHDDELDRDAYAHVYCVYKNVTDPSSVGYSNSFNVISFDVVAKVFSVDPMMFTADVDGDMDVDCDSDDDGAGDVIEEEDRGRTFDHVESSDAQEALDTLREMASKQRYNRTKETLLAPQSYSTLMSVREELELDEK